MRNTRRLRTGRWIPALVGAVLASSVWAAGINTIGDVKLQATSSGAQLVLTGSRPPTFTVFRLTDPDRLVVDIASSDVSKVQGARDGTGPVLGVLTRQFSDEHAKVGRVLVTLKDAGSYDVRADGDRVVVTVQAKGASVAAAAGDAPASKVQATGSAEPAVTASATPGSGDDVVLGEHEGRQVRKPAHQITAVRTAPAGLEVVTDGEVARYEVLELAKPARLALDVFGVSMSVKPPRHLGGVLTGLRAGAHPDRVRFVVDVPGPMPRHAVTFTARGLRWTLSPGSETPSPPEPVASRPGKDLADGDVEIDGRKVSAAAPTKRSVEIQDLSFDESSSGGRIEIKLPAEVPFQVERPEPRGAVLTLSGVRLPKKLERSLDTSALDTPVKMISCFPVPGDANQVRVVVAAESLLDEHVEKTSTGLSWRLTAKGAKPEAVATADRIAGFTSEAQTYASQGAPRRARYVGKKVSFEFKDIDIHNLLRVIAEVSKKNIVVADDVSGKVTIRLRNVPWDQALELILRSKGLGQENVGEIIRVAPLKTLEEEARSREERQKALKRQEELVVQLIPVNYADAAQMSSRVKDVLSERGTVAVDSRTNTLVVRDIGSNIGRARSLVGTLDTQTPQVLIESRIVEANTTFARQIGVQWGGAGQLAPGTNNATGLAFPNSVRVTGGVDQGTAPATGVSVPPNFAVNLPAAVGAGSGGALGFVFGSAGGALGLNLRLSALESEGAVRTISAPKVATLHNQTAKISQGVSIPFSQVSAQGVNTVFVEARLSLEVKPHITQDNSILMDIKAENNQPDPANTGANGQPAIQRKEAQTQVLVKDGDTTVIGGIYVRRSSNTVALVPFLGRIPILGFFFRTDSQNENRQELLIFITPRIITTQKVAAANP